MNVKRAATLVLLGSGIYAGVKLTPPYVRDFQLEHAFDDEARRAHLVDDAEIRRLIGVKVKEIGLADYLATEDIVIERDMRDYTISVYAEYEVPVEFPGGKVVTLHFAPEVDRPIQRQ